MAQNHHQQQQQQQQQQQSQTNQQQQRKSDRQAKMKTPMIVERVNRYPLVSAVMSMGFSQYDKLKSSNVTIGDVMTRAENFAAYVWQKVQPYFEKLQDPLNKADQLAVTTVDFVESKVQSLDVIAQKVYKK